MADPDRKAALDFLNDVASGGEKLLPPPTMPARTSGQPKDVTDFLNDVVTSSGTLTTNRTAPPPGTSPGRAALIASGDPRFVEPPSRPPEPPSRLQQMLSPIVRGLGTVTDLPNVIASGLVNLPSSYDLFREKVLGMEPSPTSQRMNQRAEELTRQWLGRTGANNPTVTQARNLKLIPEEPDWKPTGWLSRSLYDATDLGTQMLGSVGLARLAGVTPHLTRADLLSPALGGVAGGLTASIAPGNEDAESYAMAGGSMLPYVSKATIPQALTNIVDKAYKYFKAPAYSETAGRLARILGREPRQLLDEFTTAAPNAPSIQGWSPTPGGIMDDTALLGIERREADRPTPFRDPLNPNQTITPADLRQRNVEALQGEMTGMAPPGDPEAATALMAQRIEAARTAAATRAAALRGQAQTVENNAGAAQQMIDAQMPTTPPGERTAQRADAARRFHGALEQAEDRATVQGGALFDAVDPDRAARVPMYRLRDALDEVKALAIERGRTDAIPKVMLKPKDAEGNVLGDKVDDFLHNWEQEVPQPQFLANVPYERVKGLRSRLTTAQRQSVDPQEREFYSRLIKGVDDAVAESNTGGLATRYGAARDFWRDNVARPFREGPVATILKNERELTGAGTLMAPGERGGQNMQQLAAVVRRDAELYQAVVDYARADMAQFTTDVAGRVNGRRLQEWVDKHAPVLQQFPELQREFQRIASAQRLADQYFTYAAERAPALRALADRGIRNTEDTIKTSAARFYLNADPPDVITRILALKGRKRVEAAQQAMAMLKTPEAQEGLQRAYYDTITKRALGGDTRVEPKGGWRNTFTNVLDNEADVADVFLPPAVRHRMRQLDRAVHMDTARQRATGNVGSRTAEDTSAPNATDISVAHRIVQGLRGDLPSVAGGATAGAVAGASLGLTGTTGGAILGAAGSLVGRHIMLARTAAKEAALREMVFNPTLFERGMSEASLSPAAKKLLIDRIRPYVLIANTEAARDAMDDDARD